jgi:diguanylate cyclase (GGDEF)-like protein
LVESGDPAQLNRARDLLAKRGWQLSESISALTQTITLNFSRKARLSHKMTLAQIQGIRVQLAVTISLGMGFVALLGWLSHRAWRRTRTHVAQLQHQSVTDPLTSLPNRRAFTKRLDEEIARARREQTPLVLLGLDLDHFKNYNDKHGHLAGDALLREIAVNWQPLLRGSDMLARVGGEEFSVIMPNCKADDIPQLISRLRAAMPQGQTFSAGIARLSDQDDAQTLMARADLGLYSAKRSGRNRTAAEESALVSVDGNVMPNLARASA